VIYFGLTAEQATALWRGGYSPDEYYRKDAELKTATDTLASDAFSGGDRSIVQPPDPVSAGW
jgi:glycogen phosphorylase